MNGFLFLVGFCLGCVSIALLIKYKQKQAMKLMQAQMKNSKKNRVPIDVDFEDVSSK